MNSKELLKKVGAVLIALTFWQLTASFIHQKILLVSPVQVCIRLMTIWQEQGFFQTVFYSLSHIALGYVMAAVLGVLLAFLAYHFPIWETLLWPWMAAIKAVPVASFVVICLIWLTVGKLSIFISFLIVLPIIYQNILAGLKSQSREMAEMAAVFRMSAFNRLRFITIPQLAPFILSAARVTIGMAWKAGVAAEVIGTPNGSMGKALFLSKMYLATDDLLAWTVIIVAVSVICEKACIWGLKKLLKVERQHGN